MTIQEILSNYETKNYYEVLGLPVGASNKEIRSARRNILSNIHPDMVSASERDDALKATSIVNDLFEALTDKDFVKAYTSSNFRITYSDFKSGIVDLTDLDIPAEVTVSPSESYETKEKGLLSIGNISVAKSTLKKGGEVTVKGIRSLNSNLDDRKVNLPKNSTNLSILVYDGIGLKPDGSDSGGTTSIQNGSLVAIILPKKGMTHEEVGETMFKSPSQFQRLNPDDFDKKSTDLLGNGAEVTTIFSVNESKNTKEIYKKA